MTRKRFWFSVAAIWAVTSLVLVAVSWTAIVAWRFPDPDDQMRLLEVRDWLAGQRWSDVTQYRLNAPVGVAMHWSRLVDLPIAAVILLSRPLLGATGAEQLALVIVPLITLGAVLASLALLVRRLLPDAEQALMAVCLAPFCVEVLHQLRPMRIDHHGWQMALALLAVYAMIGARGRYAGWLAGMAIAVWLSISLEGLPMVAAILTLAALRWAMAPVHAASLRSTMLGTALGAVFIFTVTHPAAAWQASVCDAVSPVYLALLTVAAIGSVVLTYVPLKTFAMRMGGLAIVGIAALAPVPLIAPQCAAGPFGKLDPLVRHFWYLNVAEGLPLWTQTPAAICNTIILPLIGLVGAGLAVRQTTRDDRLRWIAMLFLSACATMAAIFVQRSGGVANLLAIPGVLWLVYPLLQRARAIASVPKRTGATLGVLLIAAPGVAASVTLAGLTPAEQHQRVVAVKQAMGCINANEMGAVAGLPRGNILAPLDISPAILLLTPHSAVASGHHRGVTAMHDVIAAFTGPEARAHDIVISRKIDYVAFCPGLPEIMIYESEAPSGFLARLDQGKVPTWLTPVEIAGSPVKVWRVR